MSGEADATAGRDDAHMRAMTVVLGQNGTAGIEEVPDPDMQDGGTAGPGWLGGLITRRVPLTSLTEALGRQPEDIKVVLDLTA